MRQSVLCAVLFLIVTAANSYSRSYYVQTRTTDTLNTDGSVLHPYLRIQQAASLLNAGDTCRIGNGVYRETVTMTRSGSASMPIVFLGESMDSVIIHGGQIITGWQPHSGNIYKATYTPTVKDLFVNRQYMTLARFPNIRYDKYAGINMLKPKIGTSPQPTGIDWAGSYLISKASGVLAEWVNVIAQTNSWADGQLILGPMGLLDVEGEWTQRNGVIYLYAPGGVNPASLMVETKNRDYGLVCQNTLTSLGYIVFRKATFFGTSVNIDNANHCLLDSCNIYYHCSIFTASNGFNREQANTFNVNGKGIVVSGSYNKVSNCNIGHSWGDGVTLYGTNNTIEKCHIFDCDWSGTDCAPITMTGSFHTIRQNTINDAGRSLLLHRHTNKSIIEYNDIFGAGYLKSDLGLTYTFANNGEGTEIRYNWLHISFAGFDGCGGIYLDNGSQGHNVHHNVVWALTTGLKTSPLSLNDPNYNNNIYNNTFAMNRPTKYTYDSTLTYTGTTYFNNIFNEGFTVSRTATYSNNWDTLDMDKWEPLHRKPGFTNPYTADFTLQQGSPCIDAGKIQAPFTNGYLGSAPDLGAYEYGKPAWQAGAPQAMRLWQYLSVPGQIPSRLLAAWSSNNYADASLALDGRIDTRWDSYYPQKAGQYFQVSIITGSQWVNKVVFNVTPAPGNYPRKIDVQIADSTYTYQSIYKGDGSTLISLSFPTRRVKDVKIFLTDSLATASWGVSEAYLFDTTQGVGTIVRPRQFIAMQPQAWMISTVNGRVWGRGTLKSADDAQLKRQLAPGLYLIRITYANGLAQTRTATITRSQSAARCMSTFLTTGMLMR